MPAFRPTRSAHARPSTDQPGRRSVAADDAARDDDGEAAATGDAADDRPDEQPLDGGDDAAFSDHPDLDVAAPAAYAELRRIAARYVRGEPSDRTLDATALVHEVWLSLSRHPMPPRNDEAHFIASCARLMRQILVTHARRRHVRGRVHAGHAELLDRAIDGLGRDDASLEAAGDAFERLERLDPRKASIVELRSFAAIPEARVAELLDISPRTVRREWTLARAWLRADMESRS